MGLHPVGELVTVCQGWAAPNVGARLRADLRWSPDICALSSPVAGQAVLVEVETAVLASKLQWSSIVQQ